MTTPYTPVLGGGDKSSSDTQSDASCAPVSSARVKMGKHTPGPWELRGPTRVYGNLQHDQNGTADLVASTVMHADAPLIAAAPDLLAVVKACRAKFEDYALQHYRKRTVEGDEKAMANQAMATLCDDAIAKAEGRA